MKPKKSILCPWSWLKLCIQRSLAQGRWAPFLVYALFALAVCGVVALVFLLADIPLWHLKEAGYNHPGSFFSAAFYHLFTNGGQNLLNLSWGWLVAVIGIILVAIITSLFTNWVESVGQNYLAGEKHYAVKYHIAVFGYHEMLPGLLKQLMESGYGRCYFLVQTSRIKKARNELVSVLTPAQMRRVILQNGSISSSIDLGMMHVDKAQDIYILGEEMMLGADSVHDTHTLQCLENIAGKLPKREKNDEIPLCHVMFEHHSTFAVLQHTDFGQEIGGKLALFPFNYYEMWARRVFVNDSLAPAVTAEKPYLPLEGEKGIREDSKDHVHLVIVGMSRMGIALGLEAAHLAHYPNFIKDSSCRTRITFIDRNARNEMYHLQGRIEPMFQTARWRFVEPGAEEYGYVQNPVDATKWRDPLTDVDSKSPYKSKSRHLGEDFIDIEWEFIQGDDENPAIQQYIADAAADPHTRLTVAVCVPDSNQAVAIALNLPPAVYASAVQVLVYQRTGDAIARLLSKGTVSGFSPYSRLRSFGMCYNCYDQSFVHRLLLAANVLTNKGKPVPSIKDILLAKASGSKSAAANLWSNIYNVCHLWTKLRSAGSGDGTIPEEEVPILGQTEHIRWNVEQLLTGFRPLTEEEQKAVQAGTRTKDALKREKYAHLDICSRARLEQVDAGSVAYDDDLVRRIPGVYQNLE